MPSDSAQSELDAGRYWHAVLLLRAEGIGREPGVPAEILLLAEAEAGWHNWGAVLELLQGRAWLSDGAFARGSYLLGRAFEERERWMDAAEAYARYVEVAGKGTPMEAVALARRARVLEAAGHRREALASVSAMGRATVLGSWAAADLALAAARDGDTASTRAARLYVSEPQALAATWKAQADARLRAGDTLGAETALRGFARGAGPQRSVARVELGLLLAARRDTAEARSLLLGGLDEASGSAAVAVARGLVGLGGNDLSLTLRLARVLDRGGDGRRALLAYDRAERLAREAGGQLDEAPRLERARLMGTVSGRQAAALEEFRALREATDDPRVGPRNLEVWAQMRSRQRQPTQVATLRRWLVESYPASSEAAEVVWRWGSDAEAGGRLDEALTRYAELAANAPAHARAGEARMRTGQIHLRRSRPEAAAEVFEAYLGDFPDGRRWEEAAYWAGRVRLELGDTVMARAHLDRVTREPVSYYAVMAADLLQVPYRPSFPAGGSSGVQSEWMTIGLARLDLLTEAGLEEGAVAEIRRLTALAEGADEARMALAEALIERGRTIDGINIAWALRDEGRVWDQRLIRIAYPFPYEELVRREAAEWGVDPFMLAALIRQESAFKSDIVSPAGAIGLMQVMPPTGAQLARAHGPSGFNDQSLATPEVNLHLGSAFFVEMSRRYGGDLPLVLSAYNAGPTRANRWRQYPEATDPIRFTERIPFEETKGYVKNVRRNLEIYRSLYGQ